MNTDSQPQDFTSDLIRVLENYFITYYGCVIRSDGQKYFWNGMEFVSLPDVKKEIEEAAANLQKSII